MILGQRALGVLHAIGIVIEADDILAVPQTTVHGQAEAPSQDARDKIAEIDLSEMNITMEELHESLGTTASRINSTSTESIEALLES